MNAETLQPFAGELRVGDDVIPTAGAHIGKSGWTIKRLYPHISEALIQHWTGAVHNIATQDLHLKGQ